MLLSSLPVSLSKISTKENHNSGEEDTKRLIRSGFDLLPETNLLGSAMSIEDILLSCNSDLMVSFNSKTEERAVGNSSVNGSVGDLSHIKSETFTDSPKEANVGDREMQSSTMLLEHETNIKGSKESNRDEVLSDVAITSSQTTSEEDIGCSWHYKLAKLRQIKH